MRVVYHLLQTKSKPGLEFSPSYLQRFKFENKDRAWEAEALKYLPFKDNLDLCLLTHSVTAHLVHIQDPPEIPSHRATWDATSWKEPKELPFHLHLPLVNQELWWGVGFTKTHMHFTASVVKILPKPQLKASSLSQTYPVCRNHHSGSHLNILSSRNWLRTIKVLPYFRLSSQTSHD